MAKKLVDFQKFTLPNGLRVIVHEDNRSNRAVFNILYNVGAKCEDPENTGFAHLFEHLLFRGTPNIPQIDVEVDKAGGYLNAFTNQDVTDYYEEVPYQNIEIPFWLESDRMVNLELIQKVLDAEKSIVIEEFKQTHLNKPYGDVWLKLFPLAFKYSNYGWSTIGKEISHIEKATLERTTAFYNKYYVPKNAILSIAGNVKTEHIKELAEKYFGSIDKVSDTTTILPKEPEQTEARQVETHANVPLDGIYIAFHAPAKPSTDYYTADLLTDLLSGGESSRLYIELVKNKKIFSDIGAFGTEQKDLQLVVLAGHLNKGVDMKDGEKYLWEELEKLKDLKDTERELAKIKNQKESNLIYEIIDLDDRAYELAEHELFGDADLLNKVPEEYSKVTQADIENFAKKTFIKSKSSTLYYYANK